MHIGKCILHVVILACSHTCVVTLTFWFMQAEKVQAELDGLAATLKQVELYNEQMKGEIAVTRR